MSDTEPKVTAGSSGPLSPVGWETAYKSHVAAVVLKAITQDGAVATYDAFRQVVEVTGRTLSTVKNWLGAQIHPPDLASLARIVEHWKIPAESIFPAKLLGKLSASSSSAVKHVAGIEEDITAVELIPIQSSDSPASRLALLYYSKNPEKALFIRQEDSDNDQLRLGELAMIDPTFEELGGDGFYLLKIRRPGRAGSAICIRFISTMVGEPTLRLSRSSTSPIESQETIPLVNGGLPAHIIVLGKVIAVLRKLF